MSGARDLSKADARPWRASWQKQPMWTPSFAVPTCWHWVMTEARAQGISIPERIAIMGFGDVPFLADMVPSLSTVRINGADMGRMAARFLIDRAEGRPVNPSIVDVGFSIMERDTT